MVPTSSPSADRDAKLGGTRRSVGPGWSAVPVPACGCGERERLEAGGWAAGTRTRSPSPFEWTRRGRSQGGGSPQLYYHDCSGRIPGHTARAPPIEFQLETHGFQFYAIANLDKPETQASHSGSCVLVWGR